MKKCLYTLAMIAVVLPLAAQQTVKEAEKDTADKAAFSRLIRPEDKMAVAQLNTALLAVTPQDSQKLTLAQSMGDLRLVLRPHDDDKNVVLTPLEGSLEADLTGDIATAPRLDKEKPKVKLAVAKQDLEPGTVIDDPEKFFTVKAFPETTDKAVTADDFAKLKGKTVRHSVFKDGVLTDKHFEGDEAPQVVALPPVKTHRMYIQNGGMAPETKTFKDGVLVAELEDTSATADKGKKATGVAGAGE